MRLADAGAGQRQEVVIDSIVVVGLVSSVLGVRKLVQPTTDDQVVKDVIGKSDQRNALVRFVHRQKRSAGDASGLHRGHPWAQEHVVVDTIAIRVAADRNAGPVGPGDQVPADPRVVHLHKGDAGIARVNVVVADPMPVPPCVLGLGHKDSEVETAVLRADDAVADFRIALADDRDCDRRNGRRVSRGRRARPTGNGNDAKPPAIQGRRRLQFHCRREDEIGFKNTCRSRRHAPCGASARRGGAIADGGPR